MSNPKSGGPHLTHLGEDGRPTMVDVAAKDTTVRTAMAEGILVCSEAAFRLLVDGAAPKGDVLAVARLAGITGGKRTGDLIPLCHMLPGVSLSVEADADPDLPGIRIRATARVQGQTGVEMEALTAVSLALLTAYDMLKSADRSMRIGGIRLLAKDGGRSGSWRAPPVDD